MDRRQVTLAVEEIEDLLTVLEYTSEILSGDEDEGISELVARVGKIHNKLFKLLDG